VSRKFYFSKFYLIFFLAAFGFLILFYAPYWLYAFPAMDEISYVLLGGRFSPRAWFLQGGAGFYDIYPEWAAHNHALMRPITQVMSWIFTQINPDPFSSFSHYVLQLLLGTYLWQALTATLVAAIAIRIYGQSRVYAALLGGLTLICGPFLAWGVPQLPMNGFDILAALFVAATLYSLALGHARIAWIFAILACFSKENAVPAIGMLALSCLIIRRWRSVAPGFFAAPLIWLLMRYLSYESLFERLPNRWEDFTITKRLYINLPFNYMRSLYPQPEDIYHLHWLGLTVNMAIFGLIGWKLSRLWNTRRKRDNFPDRLASSLASSLASNGKALQLASGLICLGYLPYITILSSTIEFMPRHYACFYLCFLIWFASFRTDRITLAVAIWMGIISIPSALWSAYNTKDYDRIRFYYERSRSLTKLLQQTGQQYPDSMIYLAHDVAMVATPGSHIATFAKLPTLEKINAVNLNHSPEKIQNAQANRFRKTEALWRLESHLPAQTQFYLEAIDSEKFLSSRTEDGWFERGKVRYRLPQLTWHAGPNGRRSVTSFGQKVIIDIRKPPVNAVLIAYDFSRQDWVSYR